MQAGGNTVLHYVASSGDVRGLRTLQTGAADWTVHLNTANAAGRTPLHLSSFNGHLAVVEELLKVPSLNLDTRTNVGCTALYLAASRGHAAIIEKLLAAGADPNIPTSTGCSTLMAAATVQNVKQARKSLLALLNGGADPNYQSPQRGVTAGHVIAASIRIRPAERRELLDLLARTGADLTIPNKFGQTANDLLVATDQLWSKQSLRKASTQTVDKYHSYSSNNLTTTGPDTPRSSRSGTTSQFSSRETEESTADESTGITAGSKNGDFTLTKRSVPAFPGPTSIGPACYTARDKKM